MALWMHGAASRTWIARSLVLISRISDGWIWYLIVAWLPWAGGVVGTSAAVRMFCVGFVNILVAGIIKRWIARPRPSQTCPGIREYSRRLDEFSFPSGHTVHAVACSVILSVYYPVASLALWPFAALVATSRVVLGLHYPSDVVVGALLGATTAIVSFNLL